MLMHTKHSLINTLYHAFFHLSPAFPFGLFLQLLVLRNINDCFPFQLLLTIIPFQPLFLFIQTLRNVVVVSVAGTTSSWYTPRAVSTASAYCKASTSSLGAVALGSATIAPLGILQCLLKGGHSMNPDPVISSSSTSKPTCLERSLQPFEFTSLIFVGVIFVGANSCDDDNYLCAFSPCWFCSRIYIIFIHNSYFSTFAYTT